MINHSVDSNDKDTVLKRDHANTSWSCDQPKISFHTTINIRQKINDFITN